MYAFITGCVVLKVEDYETVEKLLSDNGIELITEEDVKNI